MVRIAVATTGGDAPGMNACLRAIAKAAPNDVEIIGVRNGGLGLCRGRRSPPDYFRMDAAHSRNILTDPSTVLRTAREDEIVRYLKCDPGQVLNATASRTKDILARESIDGLILIGGDTTCRAAAAIHEACGKRLPVTVVPATIDNDVKGTTSTLGFESAVEEAVRSVDRIRATATAHSRLFIVEVMGRLHGRIAANVAIASGAELVLLPERGPYSMGDIESMVDKMLLAGIGSERSAIAIIAEGAELPPATSLSILEGKSGYASACLEYHLHQHLAKNGSARSIDIRTTVLGHVQRGATPTAGTRILASRAGVEALDKTLAAARRALRQGSRAPSGHARIVCFNVDGTMKTANIVGKMLALDHKSVRASADFQMDRLAY